MPFCYRVKSSTRKGKTDSDTDKRTDKSEQTPNTAC